MELPEGGSAGDGSSAAVLRMWSREAGGAQQVELIQVSPDGRRRHRLFQSVRDGEVVRRTVIDEEKITDDWRAWDAAAPADG